MKKNIKLGFVLLAITFSSLLTAQPVMHFDFETPYGNNEAVGQFVAINGAKIYYEEYGKGEPLLLIHGNGGSIHDMGNQIEYFKDKYRVIIADNRGHGKSEMNTDSLTYVQIAADWEGLAKHLKLDSINLIGWSDGGIVSLLMGINQKTHIKKMVTMGANLRPDATAVYDFAVDWLREFRPFVDAQIAAKDTTQNWFVQKQLLGLLGAQPTIATADLAKITAQALIMAGDQDIIREEHTVEIFQHIPQAQLCILPGQTHFIPASDPVLFNTIAGKFLAEPFQRPNSDFTKW